MGNPRVGFVSLGCPKALVDSERILTQLRAEGYTQLFRSKVNCLRVCMAGPIAVVYPEGIWYRNCTPDILARIVDEHLIKGLVVKEFMIADPLQRGSLESLSSE